MEAVGFETYCRLIEEAVAELEGRPLPTARQVELRLGLDLQLPELYIPEPSLRLSFYKRLASASDEQQLEALLDEVVDRYGPSPPQLERLTEAQRVRIAARAAGLQSVARRGARWRLRLDPENPPSDALADILDSWPGSRVTPDGEVSLPIEGEARLEPLLVLLRGLKLPG
jgi:transcription-repair coupling factor (superfamily II helicase)